MSRFKEQVAAATRRHKDVRVVLNGELAEQRAALLQAVHESQSPSRLGSTAPSAAVAALEEFDADLADSIIIVRVPQVSQADWRAIQRAHPVSKTDRDIFDGVKGFAVMPATMALLDEHGRIVEGDELVKPDPEDWAAFWEHVTPGDAYALAVAVLQLHEATTEQTFGDLVKA